MAAKRIIALVVAVGLVVGAVIVRSRIDDGSGASPATTAGAGGTTVPDHPPRILCTTELASICNQLVANNPSLSITIENLGATLDRADETAGFDGFDAWLTLAPFPDLVEERRQRAQQTDLFPTDAVVLGQSTLVLVGYAERIDALTEVCGGELTWRCLGEKAGQPWSTLGGTSAWGAMEPGHDSPETSAAGLLVLGQAVASYFGTPDISANIELADPAFRTWLRTLERAIPDFGSDVSSPLQLLLTQGPAKYDAIGAIDALARPVIARSAKQSEVAVVTPLPVTTSALVIATVGAARGADDLAAQVTGMLEGWDPGGSGPTGLPSGGVLDALRSMWREVTR